MRRVCRYDRDDPPNLRYHANKCIHGRWRALGVSVVGQELSQCFVLSALLHLPRGGRHGGPTLFLLYDSADTNILAHFVHLDEGLHHMGMG